MAVATIGMPQWVLKLLEAQQPDLADGCPAHQCIDKYENGTSKKASHRIPHILVCHWSEEGRRYLNNNAVGNITIDVLCAWHQHGAQCSQG